MGKISKRLIPLIIAVAACLVAIILILSFGSIGDYVANIMNGGTRLDTSSLEASAPKITVQPKPVTSPDGSSAEIAVTAEGEELSYEWYFTDTEAPVQPYALPSSDNTITVKMNSTVDGREIYCIISDKNGNSAKSQSVKLIIGNPLKITKQPSSVTAAEGAKAVATLTATGDELTYTWYYKDEGAESFRRASTFKGNSYSVTMSKDVDGRELYCIVADKHGNTLQSKTVRLTMPHQYDTGRIAKAPTCTEKGELLSTCQVCGKQTVTAIKATGHTLGNPEVFRYPTAAAEGIERRRCENCDYYVDRPTEKLETVWNITVDLGFGVPYKVAVGNNGRYYMDVPANEGYTFIGWELADGTHFPADGTVSGDTTVYARWEVDGTDTLTKLITRLNKGVKEIKITDDIVINEPLYVSYETSIYSDKDVSLLRDPDYAGDLFVVGQDRDGNPAPSLHRKAQLDLGGGQGTLSIDGNRDKLNVKVVGSAFFVAHSATMNIHDGTRIANNLKLGNERALTVTEMASAASMERAGGAAILIQSAGVNMYGGVIENNEVLTQYTPVTGEDGTTSNSEVAGCGGAVFNRGNFNMYGGTITDNRALRGGAVYNDRFVYLHAGTISRSYSYAYGGGLSTSSSANADTYIGDDQAEGTMTFSDNHSEHAGGALYSNTNAPIIIYDNAEFIGNRSDTSGGAIYTGGTLTIRGATFKGNECVYSGGAIYHHYANPDRERRNLVLEGATFEGNKASLGAAVILSAPEHAEETGTHAEISKCTFRANEAFKNESNNGNGGAIYITRKSEATVTDCSFIENKAHTNAGAIAMHSAAKVELTGCLFTQNEAGFGGALYMSSDAELTPRNLRFEGNRAVKRGTDDGHGGAIYSNGIPFDMKNFDFVGNSAENNGGAVYMSATTLTPDTDCSFENNHADGHGGVFYLTYKSNSDGTKTGSVLNLNNQKFVGNSALAGGAVSIRTDCKADVQNTTFENNSALGVDKGAFGGGAIYVGYGELIYENNTAIGNSSAGFGGVIKTLDTDLHLTNCTFEENEAVSGGALCMESNSDLVVSKSSFIKNKSTFVQSGTYDSNKGGGAITIFGATMDIDDVTFESNESKYYGGTVLASGTTVTINGETAVNNSIGQTGAALYFKGGCKVAANDLEVAGTDGLGNGVIYQNGGTLTINRLNAHDNTSYNGGVLYTSNAATVVSVNDSELCNNTATNNGGALLMDAANVELNNTKLLENTAKNGGAIYNQCGKLKMNTLTFEQNNATRHGGVLMLMGANHTLEQGLIFKNNSAVHGGGIFYVSEYVNADTEAVTPASFTVSDYTFSEHSAGSGGIFCFEGESTEASITGCTLTDNEASNGGVLYINKSSVSLTDSVLKDNTAKLGGAIYDMAGKLTISDLVLEGNTATNNGGAIDLIGAQLDIDESITFTKNSAKNHGGAIYVSYQTIDGTSIGGVLNVDNNSFTDHTALAGGAISIRSYCTANINNTSFVGNTVSGFADTEEGDGEGGGAIYVGYGTLNLNKVTFTENKALPTAEGGVGYGGAMTLPGATVTITDTTFDQNQAGVGGAINICNKAKLNVTDSAFTHNKSTFVQGSPTDNNRGGGAVKSSGSTLTFDNVNFDGNESEYFGGAILMSSSTVEINNGSKLQNSLGTTGATIFVKYNSTLTVNASTISNNTARSSGNIYINNATVQLNGATVTENEAPLGGVVSTTEKAKVYISGGHYSKNTAQLGGVAYLTSDSALDIQNTTFSENRAIKGDDGYNGNGAVIYIENAVVTASGDNKFINNSAENHGGAVYVSYKTINNEKIGGVLNMSDGLFENNTAVAGGAVSIRTNGSATMTGTTLKHNTATGSEADKSGGAIYNGFGKLTLSGATLDGNESAYYGGAIAALGATTELRDNTLIKDSVGVTGAALYFRDGGSAVLNNVSVIDNKAAGGSGVIYVTGTTTLDATKLVATGNTNNNGGVFYSSGSGKITITDSTFTDNAATNYGGVMDHRATSIVEFTNSVLCDNSAKNGGAINSQGSGLITLSGCQINNNIASENGGAVYKWKAGELKITADSTVNGNTANTGGAIFADENATITVENSAVETNSVSDGEGAVMYLTGKANGNLTNVALNGYKSDNRILFIDGATLSLSDVTAEGNESTVSGSVFAATNASVINIIGGEYKQNKANHGGVAYVTLDSVLNISDATFTDNSTQNNGGALYISGSEIVATGDYKFEGNSAANHGGAIYVAYVTNEDNTRTGGTLNMTGGSFENNSAMGGGAISIRSDCTANISGTTFEGNTVSGFADTEEGDGEGGGAIYVGYGTLNLNKVTFTENKALPTAEGGVGYGGAMTLPAATVTITDTTFDQNQAGVGGAINICNKAKLNVTDSAFTHNKSTFVQGSPTDNNRGGGAVKSSGSTLTFDNVNFDGNESEYFGGAILMSSSTVEINNGSKLQNSLGTTGATIFVKYNSTLTVNASTISNNTARSNGNIYVNNATVRLNGATVTENEATLGGVVSTTEKAKVYISGGNYSKNTAQLGGVAYLNEYTLLDTQNVTYEQNQAVTSTEGGNGNGAVICTVGGTVTATGDRFADNTAAGHAGAIYVTYKTINGEKVGGILNMTDGLFENNTAVAGGAVSIRTDCSAAITGTVFNNNHATGDAADKSGGAVYCGSGALTLSGVTLNGNESGYYGGAVASLNSTTEIKNNTIIKNSVGVTGTALYFRDGGSAVLNNVSVIDNKAAGGNGVIYITGTTTMDATKLVATGNTNENGGVFYSSGSGKITITDSTFTDNAATNYGGVMDHRGSSAVEIKNSTLSKNSAKYGGAIFSQGDGTVTLNGCTLTENSALDQGGAVFNWKAGTVRITAESLLKKNTAKQGGAVYVDQGATVTVEGSTMEENTATAGEGGAVVVADSTKDKHVATALNVSGSSFIGNVASTKGGAIATDTNSPNLLINVTGSTFSKNKANGGGGGAVEIQNGNQPDNTTPTASKIVLTGCTFTENEASSSGGAVEIRTNSHAKINGITATNNKTKGHGAVVYVTSDYSRLYLTGDVTLSGNTTSGSGKFAYLYNSSGYKAAPAIYTTHASTADWAKDVAVSSSSANKIYYDLPTLP